MKNFNIEEIDVEKIQVPNPRGYRDPEAFKELVNNLKEHILINPIKINKNKNGSYTLIFGEGRLLAFKELGRKKIKAIVTEGMSEREILLEWLTENLQRSDLTLSEQANIIKKLRDECGWRFKKIAKRLGKSIASIHDLYTVAVHGSPKLQEALNKRRKTEVSAIVRKTKDHKTQEEMLEFLEKEKVPNQRQRMKVIKEWDEKRPISELYGDLREIEREAENYRRNLVREQNIYSRYSGYLETLKKDEEFITLVVKNKIHFSWR